MDSEIAFQRWHASKVCSNVTGHYCSRRQTKTRMFQIRKCCPVAYRFRTHMHIPAYKDYVYTTPKLQDLSKYISFTKYTEVLQRLIYCSPYLRIQEAQSHIRVGGWKNVRRAKVVPCQESAGRALGSTFTPEPFWKVHFYLMSPTFTLSFSFDLVSTNCYYCKYTQKQCDKKG